MKFRVASDLHLEFRSSYLDDVLFLPDLQDDKETCLILAGDIGLLYDPRTYAKFMKHSSEQFKNIFWIGGNHEWYHSNIDKINIKMAIDDLALSNIYTERLVLEEERIFIIGYTLWTNFDNEDQDSMLIAQRYMSDFHIIETSNDIDSKTSILKPRETLVFHREQLESIFYGVDHYSKLGYKCIVVSHHQPSLNGIQKEFQGDRMNGAFASDLDEKIKKHNIEYWIAGHTHSMQKYMIGNTKVITNPLGYPSEDTGFDPTLTFEL